MVLLLRKVTPFFSFHFGKHGSIHVFLLLFGVLVFSLTTLMLSRFIPTSSSLEADAAPSRASEDSKYQQESRARTLSIFELSAELKQPSSELKNELVEESSDDNLINLLSSQNADLAILHRAIAEASLRNNATLTKLIATYAHFPSYVIKIQVIKALMSPYHRNSLDSIAALRTLLGDKDPSVRSFSAEALAKFEGEAAKNILKERVALEKNSNVLAVLDKSR